MGVISIRLKTVNGFKEFASILRIKEESLRQEIRDLGNSTAIKMRETISSNKVRPQAGEPTELEDNIQVEHSESLKEIGWGVGNISILNQKVPYWKVINFGSDHIVGLILPKGAFSPGNPIPSREDNRQGRWKKGEGEHHAIIKNPIPPMNYIEKVVVFIEKQINRLTKVFQREK